MTGYYGQPVLKPTRWRWYIPAYFAAGGLAAGSSLIAAATGDRRTKLTALGALGAGAVLLVADLGRPSRFHHMLRVVKPTSPMSMGTWLLCAYGPAVGLAAVAPGPAGRAATWAAAAFAPGVATYTAVVLADTAVPAWRDASTTLPAVFASSAASSAAGAAVMLSGPTDGLRRMAVGATVTELVGAAVMEHSLDPLVRPAYAEGAARTLSRAARVSGVLGAVGVASGGRVAARVGGAALVAASVCQRFAVHEAGKASALDPAATIGPQRARGSPASGR